MILQLIKLANKLDILGYKKESNFIDILIKKALDPQVKKLIDSGQGYTYGCPSCNKEVDIDEKVFSMFMPPNMTCPSCNEEFSPHDAGAARSTNAGEFPQNDPKGGDFGKHSLKENERGVWVLYQRGKPILAFDGKPNAQTFLRQWKNGAWYDPTYFYGVGLPADHDQKQADALGISLEAYQDEWEDHTPSSEVLDSIIQGSKMDLWSPSEDLLDDSGVEVESEAAQYIGSGSNILKEIVDKTSKILPLSGATKLKPGSVVQHGEQPKEKHYDSIIDQLENIPDDGDGQEEEDSILAEYSEAITRRVVKNRQAKKNNVDPDTLADDTRW